MELQTLQSEEDRVKLVDPKKREKQQWLMSDTDPMPPRPPSNWLASLLVMIFCFTPFGVVALVFAYLADDYYDRRDYTGSVKMSKRALRWIKASVIFQIVMIVLLTIYFGALFGSVVPRLLELKAESDE